MSLDITITQKGLFKKTLPLEVILGNRLSYGSYDYAWRLEEGKTEENMFTAFLPDALARGFSVTWNCEEKQCVGLRLLTPTAREEIREFYSAVMRIMNYWNADLTVDGEKTSLRKWAGGMGDYIEFNTRALDDYCRGVIDGSSNVMTFFSALWPLTVGRDEAEKFAGDPDAFERWMHEKQSVDAYCAAPMFFGKDGTVVGRYVFVENCRCIFPKEPSVPFGLNDAATGKALECGEYMVGICPEEGEGISETVGFGEFLSRLPSGKVSRYDGKSLLIEPVALDELGV